MNQARERRREARGLDKRACVQALIKTGLGYCCLWAFFKRNRRTAAIATRLGVTTRAIRYHKAAFRAGTLACEGCEKCLREIL